MMEYLCLSGFKYVFQLEFAMYHHSFGLLAQDNIIASSDMLGDLIFCLGCVVFKRITIVSSCFTFMNILNLKTTCVPQMSCLSNFWD